MKLIDCIIEYFRDKKCYFYMLMALLIFFCLEPILIPLFQIIVDHWVSRCSDVCYAIIIIVVSLYAMIYLVYKHWKYHLFIAHKDIALSLFVIGIYAYYRFCNTQLFDFWPIGPFSYTDIVFIPFITLIVIKKLHKENRRSEEVDNHVLLDEPIEDIKEDRLQFNNLVKSLLDDLKSLDISQQAYSIGLSASWGYGKSSFLNLFTKEVLSKGSIVVRFYPRSSRNVTDIQEDFFEVFSLELSKYHTGFKHIVKKYAKSLQITDGNDWLAHIVNAWISLDVTEERVAINDAIKKIGKRIYVFIDDLDRLAADEIFEVLKLIDRNGNFCHTVFITAYDKEYVNGVLQKMLGYDVKQDFTDKYFSYEVSLPIPSMGTLQSYFRDYISKHIVDKTDDAVTMNMVLKIWDAESKNIILELGSIRHVKRFINIFMSRYPKVKNDVDIQNFLLLTLLRYKDANVYNAIVNGDIVSRGRLNTDESYNIIYLNEKYAEDLKTITKWNGCEKILKKLFPIKGGQNGHFQSVDKCIYWINHFDIYFYDYRIGDVYYVDLIKLFTIADDDEAFNLVDNMIQNDQQTPLNEFLSTRTMEWVSRIETLDRWFKLLVCTDIYGSNIGRLLNINGAERAKIAKVVANTNDYKKVIDGAISNMVEKQTFRLGYLIIKTIQNQQKEQPFGNSYIYTKEEFIEIAERCQKYYYSTYYGTKDWNYNSAFVLCQIIGTSKQGLYDDTARSELYSLMKAHPDDFAKNMIIGQVVSGVDGQELSLEFISNFNVKTIFPVEGVGFEQWLNLLKDKPTVDVLKHVYESKKNIDLPLLVPALRDSYKQGDMVAYKEAIDAEEKKVQIDKILTECKAHFIVDITMLANNTHIEKGQIRELLLELVNKGQLPTRYKQLKDCMEPFVVGDYVRLKEMTYDKQSPKLYYINNVFKIAALDFNNIKLAGIDSELDMSEVEPIPIDGSADKDLYYNPIVAGSIIAPGGSIPVHKTDYSYYMDQMKRNKDSHGKTFYDEIQKNNCQYVHEVQHFLRKKIGEDRIMLHKGVRETFYK